MPGPIKPAPAPAVAPNASARSGPLIRRLSEAAEPTELPDATPYQSRRPFSQKVHGETLTIDEVYWTRRGLSRWLAVCPKVTVTVRPDRSFDPETDGTPRPLLVIYDGFRFDVPVGEPVEIPLPIAEIVRWSQRRHRTSQAAGLDQLAISESNPDGMYIDFEGGGQRSAAAGDPSWTDDEER